ncbi:phospholipase A2 inhibitor and Ly6/PLAUR domain-containing protein-like isoform X1 [Lithobates pipiens]
MLEKILASLKDFTAGSCIIVRTLPPPNITAPCAPHCIIPTHCPALLLSALLTMGTLIALTCILSTLITGGHAIHCTVCRAEGGDFTCTGEDKECGRDNVCAATSSITMMEGHSTKSFSRYCARRSNCGASGSIVFQGGYFKTSTSCCTSDYCSPTTPTLPQDAIRRNGLSCRSCTALDSDWCHTKETIDCTGDENRCILQRDVYSGKKYAKTAMRGCGTKTLCDLGSQNFNYGGVSMRREITCTSYGLNLHANMLLVAIAALFAHRLML